MDGTVGPDAEAGVEVGVGIDAGAAVAIGVVIAEGPNALQALSPLAFRRTHPTNTIDRLTRFDPHTVGACQLGSPVRGIGVSSQRSGGDEDTDKHLNGLLVLEGNGFHLQSRKR